MARVILFDESRAIVTDLEDGLYLVQWQPHVAMVAVEQGEARPTRIWAKEREVNVAVLERFIKQKTNSIKLEENELKKEQHKEMRGDAVMALNLLHEALGNLK